MVKSGAWYAYNNAKIGQGRENAKIYLQENPEILAEVEQKVRASYQLDGAADTEAVLDVEDDEEFDPLLLEDEE